MGRRNWLLQEHGSMSAVPLYLLCLNAPVRNSRSPAPRALSALPVPGAL